MKSTKWNELEIRKMIGPIAIGYRAFYLISRRELLPPAPTIMASIRKVMYNNCMSKEIHLMGKNLGNATINQGV